MSSPLSSGSLGMCSGKEGDWGWVQGQKSSSLLHGILAVGEVCVAALLRHETMWGFSEASFLGLLLQGNEFSP